MHLYEFFGLHDFLYNIMPPPRLCALKQLQSLIQYPQQAFVHLAHIFLVFLIKILGRFIGTARDTSVLTFS